MTTENKYLEIPKESISTDILQAIIKEFVLQEGTDYGHSEYSLESKIERVNKQLDKGLIKIFFDPETETAFLASACNN
jgi:uncharacterized protein YheU (UPF0270 family)